MNVHFTPFSSECQYLPQNSTWFSWLVWWNRYQQQLSLPVILLPSIHFTLPMLTIFLSLCRKGIDCFVCIQSASNSNQVGPMSDRCSMSGWSILRFHGGFVMKTSAPCVSVTSNTLHSAMKSDCGSMSDCQTHVWPRLSKCFTSLPSPAHGSEKRVFSFRCGTIGNTASSGVG